MFKIYVYKYTQKSVLLNLYVVWWVWGFINSIQLNVTHPFVLYNLIFKNDNVWVFIS